jgi:hypothetical protein
MGEVKTSLGVKLGPRSTVGDLGVRMENSGGRAEPIVTSPPADSTGGWQMAKAEDHCLRCGGTMVRGTFRIRGTYEARVRAEFVVPGVPTSRNPIEAFKQGLSEEPGDEVIEVEEIGGLLCRACGHIEFHAWFADGAGEP